MRWKLWEEAGRDPSGDGAGEAGAALPHAARPVPKPQHKHLPAVFLPYCKAQVSTSSDY